MGIGPVHRCLDVFVQLVERAILNLDSPPDRRIRFEQRDLELVENGGFDPSLALRLLPCRWFSLRHDSLLEAIHQVLGEKKHGDLLLCLAIRQIVGQGHRHAADFGHGEGRIVLRQFVS